MAGHTYTELLGDFTWLDIKILSLLITVVSEELISCVLCLY